MITVEYSSLGLSDCYTQEFIRDLNRLERKCLRYQISGVISVSDIKDYYAYMSNLFTTGNTESNG